MDGLATNNFFDPEALGTGQVGFPFFGALILNCLNRMTKGYSQEMFFKAAELAVIAEQTATRIE